jgi:hypothetical protein
MATESGLPALLAQAQAAAGDLASEPAQEDMAEWLGLPPVAPGREGMVQPRGRGRPPGSRNRRTMELAAYLLATHRSPLETLVKIANTPVAELAARLNCSPLDALDQIRLCAIAAAPYLHARMPVAVDVTNHRVVHLTIQEGGGAAPGVHPTGDGLAGMAVSTGICEIVDFQEVTGDVPDDVGQTIVGQVVEGIDDAG